MNWSINKNIICWENGGIITYPTAKDLFNTQNNNIGLSFSKLLALNYEIEFSLINDLVFVEAYVLRRGQRYKQPKINGLFIDYCVFDNKCYYVNQTILEVNEIAQKCNIKLDNGLSFLEYIEFSKLIKQLSLSMIDNVVQSVENIKTTESREVVDGFIGKLYPYQESGIKWLTFMLKSKCGCILADSMGLGKTLQIILTLANHKNMFGKSHFLIVAPLSLLENWKREINKFYPSLLVHINHGETNITYYKEMIEYDVIVTSYGSVQTNFSTYEMVDWDVIVLDEAQNIKNPSAKRTKTIKELNKKIGIAVSGTPFENHITDIWSIVDFILPGYLGSLKEFEKQYTDNVESAKILENYITPFMIRRKVEDVAKDLPDRIDIPQPIKMTIDEAKYYDEQLKSFDELKTMRLDKVQSLRMFCSHPFVYKDDFDGNDPIMFSQKYQRCCEILDEIVSNKEKVIIFTSFNRMIDILVKDIKSRFGIPTDYINGSTEPKDRQSIIDKFSEIDGSAALILNPKAAGAGLNITAANHVIHYNLEWNPAIEDQASARAFRRGQTKTVFIHRLFYLNTIEEVIN